MSEQNLPAGRQDLQNFEKVTMSRKDILINNFLGGIFWSLGTLVGATIILGIVGYFLSRVDFVPLISNWTSSILETTMKKGIQLPQ